MFSLHNLATLVHVTEEGSKRRGEIYEIAIWVAGQMPFMYRELAVMKGELDSLFCYLHFECCVHPQSLGRRFTVCGETVQQHIVDPTSDQGTTEDDNAATPPFPMPFCGAWLVWALVAT